MESEHELYIRTNLMLDFILLGHRPMSCYKATVVHLTTNTVELGNRFGENI